MAPSKVCWHHIDLDTVYVLLLPPEKVRTQHCGLIIGSQCGFRSGDDMRGSLQETQYTLALKLFIDLIPSGKDLVIMSCSYWVTFLLKGREILSEGGEYS